MEKSEECEFCKDEMSDTQIIQDIWVNWNANMTLSDLLKYCYQQLHLENLTEQIKISLSCKHSFLYANVILVE